MWFVQVSRIASNTSTVPLCKDTRCSAHANVWRVRNMYSWKCLLYFEPFCILSQTSETVMACMCFTYLEVFVECDLTVRLGKSTKQAATWKTNISVLDCSLDQRYTHFSKIQDPPQNSKLRSVTRGNVPTEDPQISDAHDLYTPDIGYGNVEIGAGTW